MTMKVAITVCIFVLVAVCSARPPRGGRREGGRGPDSHEGGLFGGGGKGGLRESDYEACKMVSNVFKIVPHSFLMMTLYYEISKSLNVIRKCYFFPGKTRLFGRKW